MPKVPTKDRVLVRNRAQGCCEYCMSQEMFASQLFTIEHILPKSKNGTNELENLALACQGCNSFKYTKTEGLDAVTAEIVPLYNPRIEKWVTHFEWNENKTVILGLTATGRVTIEALRLNRPYLINQRVLYRNFDVHPPDYIQD